MRPVEIEDIRRGALFHDIGKIVVADSVLKKNGPLTAAERLTINEHPAAGCELLSEMKTMRRILPIVYCHHERLDGSGYPNGIFGGDIPQTVRIVSVADVFDAVTTDRAYRVAMTFEQAWRILDEEVREGRLDPAATEALKEVIAASGIRRDPGAPAAISGLFDAPKN